MKLHFTASASPDAQAAASTLAALYGDSGPEAADIVVALGGDGFMLESLHTFLNQGKPIYGMNLGSVGFLMNEYREEDLVGRLAAAKPADIHPLKMTALGPGGEVRALAFNEVSLLRQTFQAGKIKIILDGRIRLQELICDGILVSTPAGSTAYNLSAHGPILPLESRLLALTPLSAFRPRRWRGALLPQTALVRFDILEPTRRPVSAVADNREVRDVSRVDVAQEMTLSVRMLFDEGRGLDERILAEQFYD